MISEQMRTKSVLEAIIASTEDAVLVVGVDGTVEAWNTAGERLLGYTKSEIIGRHVTCLLPPHWYDHWVTRLVSIREGTVFRGASVRRHQNGDYIDVFVTAQALRDADGVFIGYLSTLQDLRKKERRERANELLASIVRGSPEAIVSVGMDFRIQTWNAAAEALFGCPEAEALGQGLQRVIGEQVKGDVTGIWDAVRSQRSLRFEILCRNALDQRLFPVDGVSSASLNGAGVATGWTFFFSDLSQRRASEEKLRASEEFSRTVLESIQDWIIVVTLDGRVSYSNHPKWADPQQFDVGGKWLDLWDDGHRETLAAAMATARETGTARTKAARRNATGELVQFDLTLATFQRVSSLGTGLVVSARDITSEQRWIAHNRVVMRELSHRAKNLLAVVSAMMRSTAGQSHTVQQFEDAFEARLRGLSKCHELLVRENWKGASLHHLVREQLGYFVGKCGPRVDIAGADVFLPPDFAQCLGLAMHELATNSLKYGALSHPSGVIRIECHPSSDAHAVQWIERGGPPVSPPSRKGFGTEVIEAMVSATLGCEAHIAFEAEGVRWSCLLPIGHDDRPQRAQAAAHIN